MSTITATAFLEIVATLKSAADLVTSSSPLAYRKQLSFTAGEAASQVEQVFSDTRSLNSGASESLDLAGSLLNTFGEALVFKAIKLIMIKAGDTNDGNLTVGGAAANAWATWAGHTSDKVTVPPGGIFMLATPDATGFTVTAGTGDILAVANGGSLAATYDIILLGTV